ARAAGRSFATSIAMPSALPCSSANRSARALSMSETSTRRSVRTAATARSWAPDCAPQPINASVDADRLARRRVATPIVAPVRKAVTSAESMIASRRPSLAPNSRMAPWIVGSPCAAALPGKFGVRLRRKVGIQAGRFDVKATGRHVHAEDPRPVKLSVGMLAKGRLDRVDALAHAEQHRDVGTLEEQGFHRPVAHLFSLSGCE